MVVVILLLGILTATALPRFLDISTEAHDAVVDAVEGGLRTGTALFKAHWFATNQDAGVFTDWGSQKAHPTSGFPVGTSTGVAGQTIDLHTECPVIFESVLQGGAPVVADALDALAAVTDDATVHATVTSADIVEANGDGLDFIAVLTAPNTCRFVYVADSTRLTDATAPSLTYTPAVTNTPWTRAL